MGLDIFIYKVKGFKPQEQNADGIKETYKKHAEKQRKRIKAFCKRSINALKGKEGDDYKFAYEEIAAKFHKYTDYDWYYKPFAEKILPFDEAKAFLEQYAEQPPLQSDEYFRKVNLLYEYFSEKMIDRAFAFADKQDLEGLVHRVDEVLKNPSKAAELLPTCAGFFFGSTEYDDWYYRDLRSVRDTMKRLLRGYDDNKDTILFEFNY